ncbi:MAG: LptF/LptG family permease [Hydrogenimonas sp.]|nr:LptF/LptG family permease [Hydrogenimonas sp.]
MRKTSEYLLKSFSGIFFSIFLPIIVIGSLILFVRIAKLTEVTQMSAGEMLLMYGYSLPTILFYTLPVTFFAALVLTLNKLSNDFESVVLFSFGISPARLVNFFYPLVLLLIALLMLLSLGLIPITKQLTKSFIAYKSMHAVLNIEASQFGQKFGEWLVFLESKDKDSNTLHNIVLYNSKPSHEQILIADMGRFINENGVLGLMLSNGRAYSIQNDKVNQIDYKVMKIYDTTQYKPFTYQNLKDYWSIAKEERKRLKDMIIFIAISLFPIATLYFAFAYVILHPRYQKNYGYLAILLSTAIYYGVISAIAKTSAAASAIFVLLFLATGVLLFYKRVERRF